ncbi:hypothetical protein AVEN_142517-1 [Araneus ventricosus]|uniref:Uncharacterized protein n=1 Tax=Araneus ventricosus TaxID=182803 RepID=A0A4Y2CH51_ARAVE|nr:hypothetical protein AVEN_142517-1 [Araneus ventricosus]
MQKELFEVSSNTSKAGHPREAMPFVLKSFFPAHSSRNIRHVIHGGSKVCYRRSSIPLLLLSHTADFRFLASSRSPNVGRTFVFPLPSQRGPQKVIQAFQFDFKLFGIPTLPFRYANFHRFLILTRGFSFPCSKNSSEEQM